MVLHRGISPVTASPKLVKNIDERLFIGTLGVNCLEFTRRCIDTVQTSCKSVRFVYLDNGSKPENVEILKTWKKRNNCIDEFLLGFNGYNAGVAVGWNQLIRMALDWKATKIIICNNDIAFGPKTIDGLVEAFNRLRKEIPETVMVSATNHTKNPAQLKDIKQEWKYAEHPDFSCFMITPEFLDKIGYFDERFTPAFFEDNFTHHRILLQGYHAFSTDWAPYSHIASRTRHGNPNIVTHQNFRENKIKFFRAMITDTVDQEIAVARYKHWIEQYPEQKHPDYQDVLEHCKKTGFIDQSLIDRIAKMTVSNIT